MLTASVGIRSLVIGDDSCKVSGAEKGKVIVDYEVSKNLNSAVLAVACIILLQFLPVQSRSNL